MDPLEIARRQLDRLKEARKPYGRRKKVVEISPEIKVRKRGRPAKKIEETADHLSELEVAIDPEDHPEQPFDIGSITIEWDDETEENQETEMHVLADKKVIKKTLVFGASTNGLMNAQSKVETLVDTNLSPPAIKKRRTNEVDKLLGDEGVQVIMRDQQICIDDNGTLLNMQKASKTRHQRMKQEEPEKTVKDWNVCSMIVRRRSSSFSTDSFALPEAQAEAVVAEEDKIQSLLSPPKITNLFQSMKAKINKTISDNFDTIAGGSDQVDEPNNNNVPIIKKPSPRTQKVSPVQSEKKPKADTPKTLIAKRTSPPKSSSIKTKAPTPFKPKLISIHSEDGFVRVKVPEAKGPKGVLTPEVCHELAAYLEEHQREDKNCNMVLIGPIKFTSVEHSSPAETPKSSKAGSVEERNLLTRLAQFPKPIFVAVQGNVEGLGVTMLPLFDLVFAKYGAEFSCPKDPLPGISILMSSAKVDKNRIAEILYLGESATSTQAVTCGLITKEISSKNDKDFEDKVMQITKETIEGKFTERIRVLKTLWRDSHLEQALKDLNREAAV